MEVIMTKLKYGKLYLKKEDILKAVGLPYDSHLELSEDSHGNFEFLVIASDSVEHECLSHVADGYANLRRYPVPFHHKKEKITMSDSQLEQAQRFADLVSTWAKMGFTVEQAIEIIKSSVE